MQMHIQFQTPNLEVSPKNLLHSIRQLGDWVGLRFYSEKTHVLICRNQNVENAEIQISRGAMVEVMIGGQLCYSGTSDLSESGILRAAQHARQLALATKKFQVMPFTQDMRPSGQGQYSSPRQISLDQASKEELLSHCLKANQHLKLDENIINAESQIYLTETEIHYLTTSGTDIQQKFSFVSAGFSATAKTGSETQKRTLNGFRGVCQQSGLESLNWQKIFEGCEQAAHEAVQLTRAENAPTGVMPALLDQDQMLIQIHESIGHPLELDRILGDERNYAGWSFVQPKDFGQLQYGSALMNVTFDPTVPGEFASYAYDDGGLRAERAYLIQNGKLLRGLGGLESQSRLKIEGVANFRSTDWNRAPIDRMANINLEPGQHTLEQMISQVEKGIFLKTNKSWSIDDYRKKFQFTCEFGQLIENGKLTKIVKNPGYRGITVPFWNQLIAVGRKEDVALMGSPYCGKGEPSQVIRVGHSSPPCLFNQVEVFGGGK